MPVGGGPWWPTLVLLTSPDSVQEVVLATSPVNLGLLFERNMEYEKNLPLLLRLSWDDIWQPDILPYLSVQDCFRFRSTCTAAHELIELYFAQSKCLDLSNKRNASLEAFQILTDSGSNLRRLVLSGCKFITDDVLRPVLARHNRLITLDLSECHHVTAASLQTLAVSCKQLKRLILKDCHWVTRASLEYLAHHQDQLMSINLTGCWELVDQTLLCVLTKFRGLEYISVANIYSLTDQTLQGVAALTPGIIALDIRGCWRITDRGMACVAEYCKRLRVLNVTDCRDVTEQSLSRLRVREVRIDMALNPLQAARLRLDQRFQQHHPKLRLQV